MITKEALQKELKKFFDPYEWLQARLVNGSTDTWVMVEGLVVWRFKWCLLEIMQCDLAVLDLLRLGNPHIFDNAGYTVISFTGAVANLNTAVSVEEWDSLKQLALVIDEVPATREQFYKWLNSDEPPNEHRFKEVI